MPKEFFFSVAGAFRDKSKLSVFLVCIVLAALSWLMISLGKNYNSTIFVPVSYVNFPENKILINHVPDLLAVSILGSGYDLLQYDEELIDDTLSINLDNLKMSMFGDYERGYLDPALLSQQLQKRIKGSVGITRVLSDSIEFLFDLKVSRTMRIKPTVDYQLEHGYALLDSIFAEPAEVEVFGPLSILDTLSYLRTTPIKTGKLNKSATFKSALDLDILGNNAEVNPDTFLTKIFVDQLTEKQFMLELRQLNVPDSLQLLTFPKSIEVSIQIPISRYDEVTYQDFEISIDYKDKQPDYPVLPVSLSQWPSIADKVSFRPKKVEIVLSKK